MSHARDEIRQAAQRLRQGGLVAFPTETVYGLGADALNEHAVRAVFTLKGRPASNPLIVHVSGADAARPLVASWPADADALASAFWPGPLTIVLPRSALVPSIVTAGGSNVAVRCPDHALALALLREFQGPLVGPSANPSGSVSPTTAQHVRLAFPGESLLVLDGGPCTVGIESTVVSLATPQARILRPGIIGPGRIARVLGRGVEYLDAASPDSGSPGTLPSHYAPAIPARLLPRPAIKALAETRLATAAVVLTGLANGIRARLVREMPSRAADYAAELYSALRQADLSGAAEIVIEPPEESGEESDRAIWHAILDRLRRATADTTQK